MATSSYQSSSLQASFRHPVPGGALSDHARTEVRKGIILSAALHILVAIAGFLLVKFHAVQPTTIATRLYDIEVVPLSALETTLPKGSPLPRPPENPPTLDTQRSAVKISPPPLSPSMAPSSIVMKASTPLRPSAQSETKQALGTTAGEASSIERARVNYQDMVASLLARAKRYPDRALRRRMTGNGTIRIEITADGALSQFAILQSTESPILDEELKAMVDRASPFPAFPPDLRKESLALVVPITFKLDG